jgi:hypothetical protein
MMEPLSEVPAMRWLLVLLLLTGCATAPTTTAPAAKARESAVTLTGSGMRQTEPFQLAGGDYRVDWEASKTGTASSCYHGAVFRPVTDGPAQPIAGELLSASKSTTTYLYRIAPGRYYIVVSSGCTWRFTISPQ